MQHVPFRTAATQSGSFCGTVVTRELGKKNENMRVNLCGALIGIKFVMESFLCFALTPNPKEYSSHVLENHKNQVHNTLCDLSDFSHERDRQEELLHRIRLPNFFISISISHFHGQRQGHSRAMQLNMFKNACILNGVHDTQHDHVILQVSLAFLSHSSHGRFFFCVAPCCPCGFRRLSTLGDSLCGAVMPVYSRRDHSASNCLQFGARPRLGWPSWLRSIRCRTVTQP